MAFAFFMLQSKKSVNLHFRRFEFKYFIPKDLMDRIIPALLCYMDFDQYMRDKDFYEVKSLYFDSSRFKCYHDKLDGIKNRKKYRIRTYGHESVSMENFFLEIKRKSSEIIFKDRILLNKEKIDAFLLNPYSLFRENFDRSLLEEFIFDLEKFSLKPKLFVMYKRKAFFSKFDKRFRITLDYDLRFWKYGENFFEGSLAEKKCSEEAVLEVKFNEIFPEWFYELVNEFKLQKDSFSKYCMGVEKCFGLPKYF